MRIALLAPCLPPESLGGMALSVASLARRLATAGHRVSLLVMGPGGNGADGGVSVQCGLMRPSQVSAVLAADPPDLLIATGRKPAQMLPALAGGRRYRTLLYLQDAFSDLSGMSGMVDSFVFCSHYLRQFYGQRHAVGGEVIPCIVERADYAGISTSRERVLAFGLSRVKRPDTAYHVAARLPQIPVDVIRTWGAVLRFRHLPLLYRRNLTLRSPVSNPAAVYAKARVILVPSDTEGWCRVVTEGQFAGIPAIGRAVGALPESMGEGGCLLPANASRDDWVRAVARVYSDEGYHRALIAAARQAADRALLQPEAILRQWNRLLGAETVAAGG